MNTETEINTDRPIFRRSAETERAIKAMREIPEGQTITYCQLKEAMGEDPQEKRQSINTARRELLKESIVFSCVPSVGYQRLKPDQVVESEQASPQKVARVAKKSMRNLATVDPSKLDSGTRSTHAVTSAVLGAISICASRKSLGAVKQAVISNGGQTIEANKTLALFK